VSLGNKEKEGASRRGRKDCTTGVAEKTARENGSFHHHRALSSWREKRLVGLEKIEIQRQGRQRDGKSVFQERRRCTGKEVRITAACSERRKFWRLPIPRGDGVNENRIKTRRWRT